MGDSDLSARNYQISGGTTGLPVSGLMILGLQLLGGIARKLTLLGLRYHL